MFPAGLDVSLIRKAFSIKWQKDTVGPVCAPWHLISYPLLMSTCCLNELIPLKMCILHDKEDRDKKRLQLDF